MQFNRYIYNKRHIYNETNQTSYCQLHVKLGHERRKRESQRKEGNFMGRFCLCQFYVESIEYNLSLQFLAIDDTIESNRSNMYLCCRFFFTKLTCFLLLFVRVCVLNVTVQYSQVHSRATQLTTVNMKTVRVLQSAVHTTCVYIRTAQSDLSISFSRLTKFTIIINSS